MAGMQVELINPQHVCLSFGFQSIRGVTPEGGEPVASRRLGQKGQVVGGGQ